MRMRHNHIKNHLIAPFLIWVIVSLACSLPGGGSVGPVSPAPTATAPLSGADQETALLTPTAQGAAPGGGGVAVAPPPADLPPALVEVDPQPLSELLPGRYPVFYFNQGMDRGSVEAAFQVQPALPGRLEWMDDATLRYVFDALPDPSQQEITLTIQAGARAANGQALPEALEVRYQTPGPLRVAHRLPEPDAVDVNPTSAIAVTFNHPVVPLGVDSANLPVGFSIDPAPVGRGEWENTSTYVFYPQPALPGGVQFTVRVNPDLAAFAALPADPNGPAEWRFTTAAPKLLAVQPSPELPLPLDAAFRFTFNQPMERTSTEADFLLTGPDGTPIPGAFSWDDAGTEMTFKPDALLERGSFYTLILIGAATAQGGTALGESYAARLRTYPALSVVGSTPRWQGLLDLTQGHGMITVTFSAPLKPNQDWKSLVTISPAISEPFYFLNEDGTQLMISGIFAPSKQYDLNISTDLRDRWDGMLDKTFFLSFSTTRATPSLTVPVMQLGYPVIFIPQGEAEIPARVINVSRVSLARGELSLPEFIAALDAVGPQQWPDWTDKIQSAWVKLFYLFDNVTEAVGLPMTQSGRPLDAGLYFLRIEPGTPENSGVMPPALLVVSPIQMTIKLSGRQAFVWAVRLDGNSPAADQIVSFYDQQANILGTCATDAQGVCQTEIPLRGTAFGPVYAAIGLPGDPNFSLTSSNWSLGVSAWEFGLPVQARTTPEEYYLYTDRPIYRPGQVVNFRAVLRNEDNGRYSLTDKTELAFKVETYDPVSFENRLIDEIRLPLTPYGTAVGAINLPAEATPGVYTLSVDGRPDAAVTFEVAEYRKPEVDLQVTFAKPDYLRGADLAAGVQARYFFGAPAGNAPVHWVLYALEEDPALPGGLATGSLDLENWRREWFRGAPGLGFYITEGEGRTTADGSLIISIQGSRLDEPLRPGKTYRLTLEATLVDESGLPVSARASTRLHPAQLDIGVRPENWMGVAGQETIFYVRTFEWNGSPAPLVDLKARFRKVNWVQEELPSGAATFRPEYSDAGSVDFHTSERGEARLGFMLAEPGTYLLDVTEAGREDGSGAVAQYLLWVGGEGSATWPNWLAEQIELRRDADQYQAGQTARVWIPNPFGGPVLALITIERGLVMQSFVVTIEGSSYTLELPLTDQEAPNVYVAAQLLGRQNNRPAFRMGYVELRVEPSAQVLDVTVEASPQQPAPGGELTLNVRVKDASGSPVQGEFSMAVIDKAVLALADPNAPGIVSAFYDPQPLEVFTGLALAVYSGRFPNLPAGGGGGGGDFAQRVLREKFEDTAYWNGALVTDVDGVAQVTVQLPDNLTTWLVDVRGITLDGRVGEAQVELTVSQPLLVRPVTPRFVVLGDHVQLAAVVHNNTGEPLQAEVSLEAQGFRLDDPAQAAQMVDLPPDERAQVSWWGTVEDVAALDLVFHAAAGSLRDSTRPPQGTIPVLRYAAPQTFSTAGVLSEPGERVESLGLPRSFTPSGGGLRVEVTASLAGVLFEGLEAMQNLSLDVTEAAASQLLANLAAYRLSVDLQLRDEPYRTALQKEVEEAIDRLARAQNADGSWGWAWNQPGDPWITSYVLYGLGRAAQAGFYVEPAAFQRAQEYLVPLLVQPGVERQDWELDRLAFQTLALQQVGRSDLNFDGLYDLRDRLSPFGKAALALALAAARPEDDRARALIADVQAGAQRYATGVHWEPPQQAWQNWSGPAVTSAAAVEAIARLDPAAPALVDAVRYLALNRRAVSAWGSSYASAWVIQALAEAARALGEAQAGYDYTVDLNGSVLLSGRMEGAEPALTWVPLGSLQPGAPAALRVTRGEGAGRLYYTAALEVARPVENAPAVQRGLSITRAYYPASADCQTAGCPSLDRMDLNTPGPVIVRLTLVVPEDMYHVAVEDWIPAGAEVLNPRLKTSQLGSGAPGFEEPAPEGEPSLFDPARPFQSGWGWWFFNEPVVRDSSIRWTAAYLPAGTYELTYRLEAFLPGEFRVLPARAWLIYFPEVEGRSAGAVVTIQK